MAAHGVPVVEIGRTIGVCANTLRKHFANELHLGWIEASAQVAQALFRAAMSDDPQSVVAAIFWLKARAGWRERPTHAVPRDRLWAEQGVLAATTCLAPPPRVVTVAHV